MQTAGLPGPGGVTRSTRSSTHRLLTPGVGSEEHRRVGRAPQLLDRVRVLQQSRDILARPVDRNDLELGEGEATLARAQVQPVGRPHQVRRAVTPAPALPPDVLAWSFRQRSPVGPETLQRGRTKALDRLDTV